VTRTFAHGVLTLDDGSGTTSLRFAGSYSVANFAVSQDSHTGTLVTFHGRA
jgi:hypothetical protein